ncbi:hypothetical protein QBC43DRAFT_59689 [Cladorrhinum sp. PSN259]|nr:hypothetical protein QBC43DRAFT_59689 [Cladorrhinum sp. PSN259]
MDGFMETRFATTWKTQQKASGKRGGHGRNEGWTHKDLLEGRDGNRICKVCYDTGMEMGFYMGKSMEMEALTREHGGEVYPQNPFFLLLFRNLILLPSGLVWLGSYSSCFSSLRLCLFSFCFFPADILMVSIWLHGVVKCIYMLWGAGSIGSWGVSSCVWFVLSFIERMQIFYIQIGHIFWFVHDVFAWWW